MTEVGRGAAHVVNIALKAWQLGNNFGLANNGFMTAGLNNSSLMGMNGAEGAAAKAAATADNAKLHLLQCRYTALGVVAGMPLAHIGQIINRIHFLLGQRVNRRILHYVFILTTLHHGLAVEGVLLPALQMVGLGEEFFIIPNSLPARQLYIFLPFGQLITGIGRAADIAHVLHAGPASKVVRNFHNLLFTHAINQQVRMTAF